MSRREMVAGVTGAVAAGVVPVRTARPGPVRYCLNTATLRAHKLTLPELIDIAARAGYHGIEPWVDEIERHTASGGSLADLAEQARDRGLAIEGAIAFPEWIVEDGGRRAAGLESAKRAMEMVRAIGGSRIAAPPVGATDVVLDLRRVAERYRDLLNAGASAGVRPVVEVWGFSRTLGTLAEAAYVAAASGRTEAAILADVFHLYRGGSPVEGLRVLSGSALPVFHINDYPAGSAPETVKDADRVYPGDGVAPITGILQALWAVGFRGALSLELFSAELAKQDPIVVARTGLRKMKDAVALARRQAAS